jgi:transcriptional regulator with XRE-family HTH domain
LRSLHFPDYQAMVQLLVQERLAAGLTQRQLAQRLGKPHSYVSKIEVSERRIDIMELIHYLRAMRRSPARFVKLAVAIDEQAETER